MRRQNVRKAKEPVSNLAPSRRRFLGTSLACVVGFSARPSLAGTRELFSAPDAPGAGGFEFSELTIADLQAGIVSGKYSAQTLTEKYMARIEQIDRSGPALKSVIELNPDAPAIAETLDKERKSKGGRGPLHGIPVLIKDNIDTA